MIVYSRNTLRILFLHKISTGNGKKKTHYFHCSGEELNCKEEERKGQYIEGGIFESNE